MQPRFIKWDGNTHTANEHIGEQGKAWQFAAMGSRDIVIPADGTELVRVGDIFVLDPEDMRGVYRPSK